MSTTTVDGAALRANLERDAVSALLGAMTREPGALEDFLAVCPARGFVTPDAKPLAVALDLLRESGETPTLVALAAQMQQRWAADPSRWPQPHVRDIAAMASPVMGTNAAWYAERLAAEAARSRLHERLSVLAADAATWGASPEAVADRARALADAVDRREASPGLDSLMERVVASLDAERVPPLSLGIRSLDAILAGGLCPGELAVLAGRPGAGKSALAAAVAVEAARRGVPTLLVSLEMTDLSLGQRLAAREAGVDSSVFRRTAGLATQTRERLRDAAALLARLPLTVAERSVAPVTVAEVRRRARRIQGMGLVVVDYLQLLTPERTHPTREREVAEMSRGLKQLALSLGLPVLLLAQLNRASQTENRPPRLSDLRESGAIEQDADAVFLLHLRDADRHALSPVVCCDVAKSRATGVGKAYLRFEKAFGAFTEADPWPEPAARRRGGDDL